MCLKLTLEVAELIVVPFLSGDFSGAFFPAFAHCLVSVSGFDPSPVKEEGKEIQMYLLNYLVAV